jgi:hypothetical protein
LAATHSSIRVIDADRLPETDRREILPALHSGCLGTGTYLVALIVLAILLLMVIRCSLKLRIRAKTNGFAVTVSTACQLLVIGTYEFLRL